MQDQIIRVRHELRQRRLKVCRVEMVSPHMRRVVLHGDELAGFTSLAPDDHVKLFFTTSSGKIERRDYTPRHHDPVAGTLTIDFALHEGGPATQWARAAKVGEELVVGGPKGSMIIPDAYDWWLLIGDETALPAIARRIEEMPENRTVISLVAVEGHQDEQTLTTKAIHHAHWAHRLPDEVANPTPILAILRELTLPSGKGFVWIAAEASVARAVRDYVTQHHGHPLSAIKASGYWVYGQSDAHDKMEN